MVQPMKKITQPGVIDAQQVQHGGLRSWMAIGCCTPHSNPKAQCVKSASDLFCRKSTLSFPSSSRGGRQGDPVRQVDLLRGITARRFLYAVREDLDCRNTNSSMSNVKACVGTVETFRSLQSDWVDRTSGSGVRARACGKRRCYGARPGQTLFTVRSGELE
jgi:hypothetical protein